MGRDILFTIYRRTVHFLFSFVQMTLTFCYKLQRWWNHIATMLISILGNTQFLVLLY